MKHLLSIESLETGDLLRILEMTGPLKRGRGKPGGPTPLRGRCWAMIFSKSSTRTRVSFEVGIRELGGDVIFLNAGDIQLGRGEPVRDTARVLGRMVHGVVFRTYRQEEVEEFARHSGIPTINALTDQEHPCQILTDLYTLAEAFGAGSGSAGTIGKTLAGRVVTFVGDAACNVAVSWVFAAAKLGFEVRLAAPEAYQPSDAVVGRARALAEKTGGKIVQTPDIRAAAAGADVLYTDVWISMGKEDERDKRIRNLDGYRIDGEVVRLARKGALVMHCLPAYRGMEITDDCFEAHAGTIFEQAENRLHTQKAILSLLEGP